MPWVRSSRFTFLRIALFSFAQLRGGDVVELGYHFQSLSFLERTTLLHFLPGASDPAGHDLHESERWDVWERLQPASPSHCALSSLPFPRGRPWGFRKGGWVSRGLVLSSCLALSKSCSVRREWGQTRGALFSFPYLLSRPVSPTKVIRRKNKAGWKSPNIRCLTGSFSAFSGSCLREGIEGGLLCSFTKHQASS